MGYTTDFEGQFTLSMALTQEQADYLTAFAETRRMKRSAMKAEAFSDPKREAVGLPIGKFGAFFTGATGYHGQDRNDESILEYNSPPPSQPSLWCQWVPTDDLKGITWDSGEKFYAYVEWLQYITTNFLHRWGIKISGEVRWQGEKQGDIGTIVAEGNCITERPATINW